MNNKKLAILLSVLCIFVATLPALAADDDKAKGEEKTILSMIFESVIAILILVLSVVAGAIIIEHFVSLKREKLVPPEILGELEVLFEDEEFGEAMDLCEAEPSFLTNVIGAAIPRIAAGHEAMMEAVKEVGEEEAIKLHQKISWLSLLGNIAPMMGLLGTVTGMISAFRVIAASEESPKPKELAGGISEALITTCMGLIIAIPVMSAFFYFRNKVVRIVMEVGTICEELLDRFRESQ